MAVRFDASADALQLGAISSGPFSACAWFYIDSDWGGYQVLWQAHQNAAMEIDSSRNLSWWNGNENFGSQIPLQTWVHLAFCCSDVAVHTAETTQVYINGVLDINLSTGGNSVTIGFQKISNSITEWLDGRVAFGKSWAAQLTQDEILREVVMGRPQRIANIFGFYPFFAGSAKRLIDYSGQGNDWTAYGALTDEPGPPIPWGFYTPVKGETKPKGAMGFSASGDYAKYVGAPAFAMTGDTDTFTMAGWMKIRDITPGAWSYPFGIEDADASSSAWALIGISNADDQQFSSTIGADSWATPPSQDVWYYFYITGANDGAGGIDYTVGYYTAIGASPADTGAVNGSTEFDVVRICIGNDSYDEWLDSALAHVRVWTGAILTDAELRAERDSPTAVKTSGLFADWRLLDKNDGVDLSGNGRTLTLS